MNSLINMCDLTISQLEEQLANQGVAKYRAKQIFQWIFHRGCQSYDQMTNLPKALQSQLADRIPITPVKLVKQQISELDGTVKHLYQLPDGQTVESVMMVYGSSDSHDRVTVCVSTQVGCQMGCAFCATGLAGFGRNLTVGEILGQVLGFQQLLKSQQPSWRVSNVVYMGMGEPLLNYDNVIESIARLHRPEMFDISFRRVSISTCGIVPQILRLAKEQVPVVLAISLHATTDNVRDTLVPINKSYPLETLLNACEQYISITRRKITFEYIMLDGVNDSEADAVRLAKLVKGFLANVNLIPYNSVSTTGYSRSQPGKLRSFARYLQSQGIEAVIREEKGGDILAACGQLRQAEQK